MSSERCIYASARGNASIRSAGDEPALCGASAAARLCANAAAAAASRASIPLARNAAIDAGEHVAGARRSRATGVPSDRRATPAPGAPTSVSAPSAGRRNRSARLPARAPRAGARRPTPTPRRAAARAPLRAASARAARATPRARARRARPRRRRQAARARRAGGVRASALRRRGRAPGRSRSAPSARFGQRRPRRSQRRLHRLEQQRLDDGQRRARRRDRDVARVRAKRRLARRGTPLRSFRASRRQPAPSPSCTWCRARFGAAPVAGCSSVTRRTRVSACSSPMSATSTSPA